MKIIVKKSRKSLIEKLSYQFGKGDITFEELEEQAKSIGINIHIGNDEYQWFTNGLVIQFIYAEDEKGQLIYSDI